MKQQSPLLSLPVEIWYAIEETIPTEEEGGRCRTPTLFSLCLTCRSFNEMFRPRLYAHIDLSMHTMGYTPEFNPCFGSSLFESMTGDLASWPDNFDLLYYKCPRKALVARRQELFLVTMLKQPKLSEFVTSFTWTLFFGPELDEQGEVLEYETRLLEEVGTQSLVYPHTETWTVFSRLEGVRYLDLGSLHLLYGHEYVRNPPPHLFPKARSIKLAGWMSHETAKSILWHPSGEAADSDASSSSHLVFRNIYHLELNNLRHYGSYPDGKPIEGFYLKDYVDPLKPDSVAHINRSDTASLNTLRGTLAGILTTPLIKQCAHLTDLALRRANLTRPRDIEWDDNLRELAEETVHKEWASFVLSVRTTLRRFRFEDEGRHRKDEFTTKLTRKIGNVFFKPLFCAESPRGSVQDMWPSLKFLEVRLDYFRLLQLQKEFPEVVAAFEQLGGLFEEIDDFMSSMDKSW